jgi:hypothetical protein
MDFGRTTETGSKQPTKKKKKKKETGSKRDTVEKRAHFTRKSDSKFYLIFQKIKIQ